MHLQGIWGSKAVFIMSPLEEYSFDPRVKNLQGAQGRFQRQQNRSSIWALPSPWDGDGRGQAVESFLRRLSRAGGWSGFLFVVASLAFKLF